MGYTVTGAGAPWRVLERASTFVWPHGTRLLIICCRRRGAVAQPVMMATGMCGFRAVDVISDALLRDTA